MLGTQETQVQSLGRKEEDPVEEGMQPTPVFLPGESQGQRSLAGYSPWGHKELDTTEATLLSTTHSTEGEKVLLLFHRASLGAQAVKNPPAVQETWVHSLGREDPLEEGMATQS